MRSALVNANPDLAAQNRKYVMRITGDNPEGKAELDNFIHPEERHGIHPDRIPAMLSLLQDLAVDVERKVGERNPMRQVIVNTHSPSVVACAPADSVILAEATMQTRDGKEDRPLVLRAMPGTWRVQRGEQASLVPLLGYLVPAAMRPADNAGVR